MATTLLLLEAFLNWPSGIKPSFFCDIVPLCSFAHCPSVLIDTYLSDTYNMLGTVLGSECKKIKKN